MKLSRPNYNTYIKSAAWYRKHPDWLKRSGYRCAMLPWVQVGKGKPYHCHHLHYGNLGSEELWRDVVVLCPLAHNQIIHGILSWYRRPSQQQRYPNSLQRFAHRWCCLPLFLKLMFGMAIALLLLHLSPISG